MNAKELEKLLAEVTPGEWGADTDDYGTSNTGGHYVGVYNEDRATLVHVLCRDMTGNSGDYPYAPNARLIALAPALARRVIAAEKLVGALRESQLQIIYLHSRLGKETGSGNAVISGNASALAEWEAAQ